MKATLEPTKFSFKLTLDKVWFQVCFSLFCSYYLGFWLSVWIYFPNQIEETCWSWWVGRSQIGYGGVAEEQIHGISDWWKHCRYRYWWRLCDVKNQFYSFHRWWLCGMVQMQNVYNKCTSWHITVQTSCCSIHAPCNQLEFSFAWVHLYYMILQ